MDNTTVLNGRYKKGQSGNAKGRPKGSYNKTTQIIRGACPEILLTVIEQAKEGNLQAAALILSRGVPPLKAAHEPVGLLTPEQLQTMTPAQRADVVSNAALAGALPADVADALLSGIMKGCQIVESAELEARIAALEEAQND